MKGMFILEDAMAQFKPFEDTAIDDNNSVAADEAIEAGVADMEKLKVHFKQEMDAHRVASKEVCTHFRQYKLVGFPQMFFIYLGAWLVSCEGHGGRDCF